MHRCTGRLPGLPCSLPFLPQQRHLFPCLALLPLYVRVPSAGEVDVVLVEAKPNDPAVPEGKVLARVGGE